MTSKMYAIQKTYASTTGRQVHYRLHTIKNARRPSTLSILVRRPNQSLDSMPKEPTRASTSFPMQHYAYPWVTITPQS